MYGEGPSLGQGSNYIIMQQPIRSVRAHSRPTHHVEILVPQLDLELHFLELDHPETNAHREKPIHPLLITPSSAAVCNPAAPSAKSPIS